MFSKIEQTLLTLMEPNAIAEDVKQVLLVIYLRKEELDDGFQKAIHNTKKILTKYWKAPVKLLSTLEEMEKLNVPHLLTHNLSTDGFSTNFPYYIVEYQDGSRDLIHMVATPKSHVDPMFG